MNRKGFLKSIGLITGALIISPQMLVPKSIPEPSKFSDKIFYIENLGKRITIRNIGSNEYYKIDYSDLSKPTFDNHSPEIGWVLFYQDGKFLVIGTTVKETGRNESIS